MIHDRTIRITTSPNLGNLPPMAYVIMINSNPIPSSLFHSQHFVCINRRNASISQSGLLTILISTHLLLYSSVHISSFYVLFSFFKVFSFFWWVPIFENQNVLFLEKLDFFRKIRIGKKFGPKPFICPLLCKFRRFISYFVCPIHKI